MALNNGREEEPARSAYLNNSMQRTALRAAADAGRSEINETNTHDQ
jgi:hypothetical protein